ncbi:MAG TPA: hypothetical protein VGL89_05910 [Candidatus Koribacter sp.]|jgi:hypothetical protein
MQTYFPNKFYVADLHQEIDLYDRKIAHCLEFEKFNYESERTASLGKLRRKRQQLVKLALRFASEGVEYDPKFLPRSMGVGKNGELQEVEVKAVVREAEL